MELKMLRLTEVATILGLHPRTVWEMARSGTIKAVKFGNGRGQWRVRSDDLKELMQDADRGKGDGAAKKGGT